MADERVAVDWDNTLTEDNAEYWNGEEAPIDEAVAEWVRDQYHSGKSVFIWTARPWEQARQIAGRLTKHGIPFHGIRCEKGSADVYVDDKAVRPEDVTGE